MRQLAALLLCLITLPALAQTQWLFSSRNGTSGPWAPVTITGQNSKVFGLDGSGNLTLVTNGGASALGSLTDVTLNSLQSGQLLRYNGTAWENWTPGTMSAQNAAEVAISGGSLANVQISNALVSGLTLMEGLSFYNSGTEAGATLNYDGAMNLPLLLPVAGTRLLSDASDLDASRFTTGVLGVTNGGTGADNEIAARAALGLSIGVDVQAYDENTTILGSDINLQTETSGNLPTNRLNGGTGAGSGTFWRGDGFWAAVPAGGSNGQVQYNNAGGFGGLSGLTLTSGTLSAATITKTALGTTSVAGVTAVNSTAAAVGAQQVSPMLLLQGNGWKTTATAASQTVAMGMYALPVQGTTAPTGELVFSQSINGGALTTLAKITRDSSVVAFKLNNGIADLSVAEYAIGSSLTINAGRFAFTIGGIPTFLESSAKLGYLGNLVLTNDDYTTANSGVLQLGADAAGPDPQTLKGADRITSDGVGGNLTIAGGRNRGANAGGSIIFQTARTASAATAGTLTTTMTLDGSGNVIMVLPTSSAGLPTGALWNDSGTVKIVP